DDRRRLNSKRMDLVTFRDFGRHTHRSFANGMATLLMAAALIPATPCAAAPDPAPVVAGTARDFGLADLSARLLPAVVNISSTQ
ncbi:hypothetical protein ABTH94_21435, partial [Acinetobacter baumannii]